MNCNKFWRTGNPFTWALICLLITHAACNSTSKKNPSEVDRIAIIYADLVMSSLNDVQADSLARLQSALDKHRMTREEFETQLSEIEKQPEFWFSILTKVVEELKKNDPGVKTNAPPLSSTPITPTKK